MKFRVKEMRREKSIKMFTDFPFFGLPSAALSFAQIAALLSANNRREMYTACKIHATRHKGREEKEVKGFLFFSFWHPLKMRRRRKKVEKN